LHSVHLVKLWYFDLTKTQMSIMYRMLVCMPAITVAKAVPRIEKAEEEADK